MSVQQLETSAIRNYWDSRFEDDPNPSDSKIHDFIEKKFELLALGLSFLSNPLIGPPSPVKEANPIYNIAVKISVSFGYSIMNAWAFSMITKEMMEPMGSKEWKIVDMRKRINSKIMLVSMALAIGIFAQWGVMTLHKQHGSSIYTQITDLAVGSYIPAYSALLILKYIKDRAWQLSITPLERNIVLARDRYIHALQADLDQIPRLNSKNRKEFGNSILQRKNPFCVSKSQYEIKEQNFPKKQWLNLPGYVIGTITGTSLSFGLGYIRYLGLETIGNHETAIAVGALTGLIFFRLLVPMAAKQTAQITRAVSIVGFEPDLTDRTVPKMAAIFKACLILTLPLAWKSATYAANAYFDGWLNVAAKVTWSAGVLAILTGPLLYLQNEISKRVALKHAPVTEDQNTVAYTLKAEKFIQVLRTAPLHLVAHFLNEMLQEDWNRIVSESVSRTEFTDYYLSQVQGDAAKQPLLENGKIV